MDPAEYRVIRESEDDHWWYLGLHDLVGGVVKKSIAFYPEPIILDAGCGTGGLLAKLQTLEGQFIGLEFSTHAFLQMKSRGLQSLVRGDSRLLPFKENSFDLILSMDVLCVFGQEEIPFVMKELYRVLKPSGKLILNLPAYPWLISGHDRFVGNKSRFYRSETIRGLKNSGFEIEQATYRNCFLFPLACLVRLLNRLIAGRENPTRSDVRTPGPFINRILSSILYFENSMIQRRIRFPFGLSLFIIARKPDFGAFRFTEAVAWETRQHPF